ncbi:MAG: RsmB/NOP family class I SAM-dependent RNA methyltransferase [Azovibrio sp.]|uniref:RsmB/NOP family class I SAM-dependent RNA methyltransferase n=1 Tax=Azovibrio sp. TaxID=1872673 RepID=UPI003C78ADAE
MNRAPRLTPALFVHAERLLLQLLTFDYPADGVLSRYFREHRNLGQNERGFLAELLFSILRHLRSLKARCDGEATQRHLLLAALVMQGYPPRELELVARPAELEWMGQIEGFDAAGLGPAEQLDLPDWLYEKLVAQWGEAEVLPLVQALNRPAPLDLRVNELKSSRKAVLERLQADGIACEAGRFSPMAIRLAEKPALSRYPLFQEGVIEVQDEGSQLLGLLLAPRRGEMVVDFCAGAGGKTLLLGALMRNTGRLYAFDVSEKRLSNLKPRLARSGLSNVHPVRIESERDIKIKRLAGKIDRVLVDAPCSGLGTLRRNPDLKWRQTPEGVAELTVKQASILAAAARLVKPGGRLVYATCSLLQEENEAIVAAFLAASPEFRIVPVARELEALGWQAPGECLQLLPHVQGTDGFFAALLERRQG